MAIDKYKKMKKLLILGLLTGSYLMNAQGDNEYYNLHEIKFNMGLFLANTSIESSYEYFFSPYTSVGGTLYFNREATRPKGNFGIGPNLRAYFGYGPPGSGFFAEAFGLYYTGENNTHNNDLGSRNNDYGTTALGLSIGHKWVTFGERFTLEAFTGLGRNINPANFQNAFIYRGGLSLGFRF